MLPFAHERHRLTGCTVDVRPTFSCVLACESATVRSTRTPYRVPLYLTCAMRMRTRGRAAKACGASSSARCIWPCSKGLKINLVGCSGTSGMNKYFIRKGTDDAAAATPSLLQPQQGKERGGDELECLWHNSSSNTAQPPAYRRPAQRRPAAAREQ